MKKKWRKRSACICTIAMSAVLLAACGNSGQEENSAGNTATISVGDIPSADTDPEANKICMERIAAFEKNNPSIKIKPDTYVFSPDSYSAMAAAGTLPTTYHLPFTQAKNVIDNEYTEDVTEVFKKYGIYDQISDTIMEKISSNGKIYLIPEACYDSGIALNMKLYRQAGLVNEDGTPKIPATWEELAENAQTIKEKTGKTGFAMPASGWRFMAIAWSFGGEFLEQKRDGTWKAVFDSPEVVKALEYVKDLKWKYNAIQENILISSDNVSQLLASGEAGMMFGEPIQVSACTIFGMDFNDVGMIQMPAGPARHVTLIGGTYSAINKGASDEEVDAVIKWLTETSTLGLSLTDQVKENVKSQIEQDLAVRNVVGINTISPWKSDNPVQKFREELSREKANVNLDYVKSYNDKSNIEFHEEEPVAASPLYRTLGNCIQEVWTNENADCAALLKQAAADFQKNQLDNLK